MGDTPADISPLFAFLTLRHRSTSPCICLTLLVARAYHTLASSASKRSVGRLF
jgi:hypothetical protein